MRACSCTITLLTRPWHYLAPVALPVMDHSTCFPAALLLLADVKTGYVYNGRKSSPPTEYKGLFDTVFFCCSLLSESTSVGTLAYWDPLFGGIRDALPRPTWTTTTTTCTASITDVRKNILGFLQLGKVPFSTYDYYHGGDYLNLTPIKIEPCGVCGEAFWSDSRFLLLLKSILEQWEDPLYTL